MGHTALGHCCLGQIHWHCTAWAEVVVVVVVVEEVGIGQGHSITRCQVRCPCKEGHGLWAGPTGSVRWADGHGVQGRAGGRRLGQHRGGQRRRGMSIRYMGNGRWPKVKTKSKGEGKRRRRNTFLIGNKLYFVPYV